MLVDTCLFKLFGWYNLPDEILVKVIFLGCLCSFTKNTAGSQVHVVLVLHYFIAFGSVKPYLIKKPHRRILYNVFVLNHF